jgi:hypothetical protein
MVGAPFFGGDVCVMVCAVRCVWLSIWYEHSASMCVKGVLLVLSYVESKEEQFSEVKKMHLVFS